MKKAPVSLCIMVKNEPLLEKCILSIRDHVKEIVIIDTGSTDGVTVEIGKKYADIFEIFTDCNDPATGLIEDFSKARNYSLSKATQPFILWADADDIISGGENIGTLIEGYEKNKGNLKGVGFLFPYEYSYDEVGNVNCVHYRERLFSRDTFKFVNPVHECAIPITNDGVQLITDDSVVWKHQRQYSQKPGEPGRNLRILRKFVDGEGKGDARQLYYIGLECANAGLTDEAVDYLNKYIEISGWEDEKAMATLKLVDISLGKSDYKAGLKWAFNTIELKEHWGEGYFAIAKMFYLLAQQGGPNEHRYWEKCVYFAKHGLSLSPTKTVLFVNPADRGLEIHRYLNVALNKLGNVDGALESVETGLKFKPTDPALNGNRKLYKAFLARRKASEAVDALKEVGALDSNSGQAIVALLNNQPINISSPGAPTVETSEWKIPEIWDFDGMPIPVTDRQLQATIIMMWKQYMLRDETDKALIFLENVPEHIKNSSAVTQAITTTENFKNQSKFTEITAVNPGKLSIVMFAGDGVEEWTSESIKKTGIGGSELMMAEMAKRLATLGHNVQVYNSCGAGAGTYEGVRYLPSHEFKNLNCDVLIASRRCDVFDESFNVKSKLNLIWVHDLFIGNAKTRLLLKADRILALSEFHKQFLIGAHNLHPNHIITTRNGINIKRFDKNIKRDPFKCINSSSPDRSWPILLTLWPEIKKQVPEASLTLAYGWKNWEFAAQNDQLQKDLIRRLKDQIDNLRPAGVNFIGRVDQNRLADEMLSAGSILHPTWFQETSGITFMEGQAAGLKVISSALGALPETVGDRGYLISGKEWTSEEYKNEFVKEAVSSFKITNDDRSELQKHAKESFCLDQLAKDWEEMLYKLINDKVSNPIVPYMPTEAYR